jgi:alpha-L-fucosidase
LPSLHLGLPTEVWFRAFHASRFQEAGLKQAENPVRSQCIMKRFYTNRSLISSLATALIVCTSLATSVAAAPSVERLQKDFRELGFGMFIHYNMATYHNAQWVAGYPSPSTFNPGGSIDTDAWADAAKSAGMTYAVLTVKHVAGFCLWDSKYTTYDVMHPDCPVKEDLVAKFIKSFTSRGLKVGLYYCWRSPGFADRFKVLPPECDPAKHGLAEQIEFQKKQIEELVATYPEAFYLWNDGLDDTIMTAEEANAWIRSLGPNMIASGNWWDWKKKGQPFVDIAVTETFHFKEGNTAVGETCWKLEDKWFWEEGFKTTASTANIAAEMKTAHTRNANFLLNVGPDKQGRILDTSLKVLAEIPEHRGK